MSDSEVQERDDGSIEIRVAPDLYCGEAAVQAAHHFTGACHVQVTSSAGSPVVRMWPKNPGVDLKQIAKDFHNVLLDQQLRIRLRAETGEIQRMIIAEAFAPLERLEED